MAKKTEWTKTKKCGHQTKWIKIERIQNRVDKNSGKKKNWSKTEWRKKQSGKTKGIETEQKKIYIHK